MNASAGQRPDVQTPSPFLLDGHQWAWNSVSLGLAKDCARKYKYVMLDGWTPKGTGVHLVFGSHYAKALERFHKYRTQEYSFIEARSQIVHQALIDSWGWDSDHPSKNRQNLIRSIIWYLEEYRNDPCETVILADGTPAVELKFEMPLTKEITLVGHLDRLVTYAGGVYVQDQKAQPATTRVLTPNGWCQIGNLLLGDELIGRDGTSTTVIGLFPKGKTDTYRVAFNDHTSVICGYDHLWTVGTQMNTPWQTLDIKDLKEKLHKDYRKYHVPLVKPVQHPRRELPLDPYVLGVLLGDGYFGGNTPILSTSHTWLAETVAERLPQGDTIRKYDAENYSWGIKGERTTAALKELGLWGKLSAAKFVPEQYLIASEAQRRDLLRGLLVTDGTWDQNRRKYDSTSIHLTEAVCSLVRSLGGIARYSKRFGERTGWRVSLRLPEGPNGTGKRFITDIIEDKQQETICIQVAASDGLYVTENYTVTHNTTGSTLGAYWFNRFNPDNQMSLYSVASRVVYKTPVLGVMIDAAQIAVGFTRFARGFTYRTEAQCDEWLHDTEYHIKETWRAESAGFPLRDTACQKYGGCQFLDVCSKDERVREEYLKSDFEVKFHNPLEVR